MTDKNFHIPAGDIKQLVDHNGGCIATDMITVDGHPVGYMYREPPSNDADMGWRFMAGDESDEYMDDADNHGVYTINTIANYDNDILPFLDAPIGSAFARNPETDEFESVDSPLDPDDSLHPDFPVVTGYHQLTTTWSVSLPLKFSAVVWVKVGWDSECVSQHLWDGFLENHWHKFLINVTVFFLANETRWDTLRYPNLQKSHHIYPL